jgi:hypothetical protein
MLPPHQPTRRKKISVGIARKPSHTRKEAKAKVETAAGPRADDARVRPVMRVLGRAMRPSPVAAARKRRLGC